MVCAHSGMVRGSDLGEWGQFAGPSKLYGWHNELEPANSRIKSAATGPGCGVYILGDARYWYFDPTDALGGA